jgi:hypothetical protein
VSWISEASRWDSERAQSIIRLRNPYAYPVRIFFLEHYRTFNFDLNLRVEMIFSKELILGVMVALAQRALGTTVTAFAGSLAGSLAADQSSYCAAIASSCPFAQTGEAILYA